MATHVPPIRYPVRDTLQKAGLLPIVRDLKAIARRETHHWIAQGCPSPAPQAIKLRIVRSYVQKYATPVFIETGTFLGSTIEVIARTGVRCHSIEIDPAIHARAKEVLSRHRNVEFILGDSGVELPKLISALDKPATFWLDGHYSGGVTGRAEVDSPISVELDAILNHPVKRHVVLIDDARCFDGTEGYPRLSDLLSRFDDTSLPYRASVSADIIRIEPRT